MTKKEKLSVLSFVVLAPLSVAVLTNNIVPIHAESSVTIEDELDDLTKVADAYKVASQSSDVGFGNDNRIISTYEATEAPTAATMWDNYGYIQYSLTGQNLLSVVADESTICPAPLVFAKNLLEVTKVETETSSNWTRNTYLYVLPTDAEFVRIIPSSYNSEDGSIAYWSQQITKVSVQSVLEDDLPKKDEPQTPSSTIDELDDLTKVSDAYQVSAQNSDVGFGMDSRYITKLAPTVAADSTNWWDASYGYIQYDSTNKNLVKVSVDTDPLAINYLPHIGLAVNYGGSNNKFVEVNNYETTTSDNWTRITYTFVLEDNANWARVIFSAYNSYDNTLQTWMQQVTKVTLEHVDTLPEKGEVPTITPIVKPDVSEIPVIEEECNEINGNPNFNDAYRVEAKNGKLICFAEATQEYTDATWWEGTNGYVQLNLNGQNILYITALVEENVAKYINPIGLYAGAGNQLSKVNVNNVIKGDTIDGWTTYTYVYLLNSQSNARLIFSSYNSPDGLITAASLQIDSIKAEYLEEDKLPAADVVDTSHDETKKAIDEFVATFNKDDYSKTNYDYIVYYANIAKHDLATSTNDEEILNAVKERINNIKTIAEEANEAKKAEINALNDYFNSLDQTRYTQENWEKIAKIYNDAISELEDITDIEQVKQIIADVKEDITSISEIIDVPSTSESEIPSEEPSITPSETPSITPSEEVSTPSTSTSEEKTEDQKPTKKGCKGSASMGLLSLVALLGVVLKKKR